MIIILRLKYLFGHKKVLDSPILRQSKLEIVNQGKKYAQLKICFNIFLVHRRNDKTNINSHKQSGGVGVRTPVKIFGLIILTFLSVELRLMGQYVLTIYITLKKLTSLKKI